MRQAIAISIAAALAAAMSAPALAQDGTMISASRPEELVKALQDAGYGAVFHDADGSSGPWIDLEFTGGSSSMQFYNCDPGIYTRCQSLLLRTKFDREKPMSLKTANEIMAEERFVAIHVNKDGDTVVDWDIVTGDGIPRAVFFRALQHYSEQVDNIADRVFAGDRKAKGD
jgi:hypothetical protein